MDIDGVMYPFFENLRPHVARATGRRVADLQDPPVWDLALAWTVEPQLMLELLHDAVDNGTLMQDGAPYPGVVAGLTALRAAGHRIHVVTDRAGLGHVEGRAENRTTAWLASWAIPYDTVTFTGDKTSVHTDVFIEDRPTNYRALSQAGVDTYLRVHPYNAQETAPASRRVHSFAAFTAGVLAA